MAHHSGSGIVPLTLAGVADTLTGTADHPIFSEDRGEYVPLGDPTPGERVRTADGWAIVESLARCRGQQEVYNLEVDAEHRYFVGSIGVEGHNAECGRNGAFRQAKRDAGIPMNQHPDSVTRTPLKDQNGNKRIGPDGRPIMAREHEFDRPKIVIQDHGARHQFIDGGTVGPHLNVRPDGKRLHGTAPGTQPHYFFGSCGRSQ